MKELIVKKYVKALIDICDQEELKLILSALQNISNVFEIEKFKTIIESPDISKVKKLEMVLSINEEKNKKLENLIKLLNENDRLLMIPHVKDELQVQVSLKDNIFEGEIVTDGNISDEEVQNLENNFGKKFGAKVKLNVKQSNYPGLKISIDSLGVEASFSVQRLKTQITEHILKAI